MSRSRDQTRRTLHSLQKEARILQWRVSQLQPSRRGPLGDEDRLHEVRRLIAELSARLGDRD